MKQSPQVRSNNSNYMKSPLIQLIEVARSLISPITWVQDLITLVVDELIDIWTQTKDIVDDIAKLKAKCEFEWVGKIHDSNSIQSPKIHQRGLSLFYLPVLAISFAFCTVKLFLPTGRSALRSKPHHNQLRNVFTRLLVSCSLYRIARLDRKRLNHLFSSLNMQSELKHTMLQV